MIASTILTNTCSIIWKVTRDDYHYKPDTVAVASIFYNVGMAWFPLLRPPILDNLNEGLESWVTLGNSFDILYLFFLLETDICYVCGSPFLWSTPSRDLTETFLTEHQLRVSYFLAQVWSLGCSSLAGAASSATEEEQNEGILWRSELRTRGQILWMILRSYM